MKIPKGTILMGSPTSERGRYNDEIQHQVTLTQDYYLGKTEVTQRQWVAVMGNNPSAFPACGLECPVETITWIDVCGGTTGSSCTATSFIGKLNAHLSATGQPGAGKLRLPTEAEWERAARAGTNTRYSHGDVLQCGDGCEACTVHEQFMWWCGNAASTPHPVAQKLPNPYGLYDMHGNVWEWVADWYAAYPSSAVTDPTGPATGASRTLRGGCWDEKAQDCRSAIRTGRWPAIKYSYFGFRLARSL